MIQALTLLVISILVVADQLIKKAVVANLAVGESCLRVPGFIEIQYCRNYGGMMGTFDGMAKILSVIAIIILIAVLAMMLTKKIKFGVLYVGLAMIVAGGIGNLIDRVMFGYVIDYINVLFVDFYIFNFADCLITVGSFGLIIYEIYELIVEMRKKGENNG